ncbi:hypothetical protein CABS01_07525 [Colletotrichum abscissum]|uniref:CFEM domain-containing protein n=2 Tax=Colletotrichum acutatum species complex TaxID=2707335 RepID=A0A9P9XQL0_9PEZI|nr:uncharacterized protein CTAM01_16854 [Colletotrichum tamarilloi]XP_060403055.1 uncharacterized protein CABS01_07525 [Colletotrichum abscissum]KAK1705447.1 hypothetical protein BDP67DRAFT_416491 [Colletotrichum lupini]KAI3558520.1 hypothetical protein CABS02_01135 [Colletotrichum abscissum]KAK1470270.1 hypothetical protein CTAM01_16854 [Colletotrichum tamarilloi]KAK1511567.1 hypothetical protein CABS01_07525 [Colletotrichum abscissum]
MKYAIVFGLLSGLAAAQSATTSAASSSSTGLASLIAQLPSCAVGCISTAASNIGCSATDFTCLCASQDKLISSLTPCVLTAGCSTTEIAAAAKIAPSICSEVQSNPAASDLASASNLVTGVLGTAAATASSSAAASATATPAAAARPTNAYYGMLGAVALAAAAL